MEKKTWQTPTLIILVRSKPEEAVLNGCKTALGVHDGPGVQNYGCPLTSMNPMVCAGTVCAAVVTS